MQKKPSQNKDFRTVRLDRNESNRKNPEENSRTVRELLTSGAGKLEELKRRLATRYTVLTGVQSALPAQLAAELISAGLEDGQLTLGASSAAWASRLRYVIEPLKPALAALLDAEISVVKVRVARASKA
jgi:hypothetical protein